MTAPEYKAARQLRGTQVSVAAQLLPAPEQESEPVPITRRFVKGFKQGWRQGRPPRCSKCGCKMRVYPDGEAVCICGNKSGTPPPKAAEMQTSWT